MKVGVDLLLIDHPVTLRLSGESTGWEEISDTSETVGCAAWKKLVVAKALLAVGLREVYVYLCRSYP